MSSNGRSNVIDLDQPRSVAQVIGAALRLYARYPLLLAALALLVVVPYELAIFAITHIPPLGSTHERPGTTLTLGLLDVALIGPLVSALYVSAVMTVKAGGRPGIVSTVRPALAGLPVVVAAQIVAALAIAAGLAAFVLPGVIVAVRLAVVAQAAAIERPDWIGALRRSLALTRGNAMHVFAVVVCSAAVDLALAVGGGAAAGTTRRAPEVVLGIVVVTLARSFAALITAVLYFDLVARDRNR